MHVSKTTTITFSSLTSIVSWVESPTSGKMPKIKNFIIPRNSTERYPQVMVKSK